LDRATQAVQAGRSLYAWSRAEMARKEYVGVTVSHLILRRPPTGRANARPMTGSAAASKDGRESVRCVHPSRRAQKRAPPAVTAEPLRGDEAGASFRALICPTGKSVRPAPFRLSSPSRKNILIFRNCKSVYIHAHPVPTRGALRGRHGRWVRDAVDATVSAHESVRANDTKADGEVVWS
jgi:hypothetical protein